MRTTVTLDPDSEALIKRLMRERRLSFKEAVNEAIRRGLATAAAGSAQPFQTPTFRMGWRDDLQLDRALALVGELEDEELARRIAARK